MAKMKAQDLAFIYNNIARNKKLPPIMVTDKLTLHEVADKIEKSNLIPFPDKNAKKMPQFKKLDDEVPSGIIAKILYLFTGLTWAK